MLYEYSFPDNVITEHAKEFVGCEFTNRCRNKNLNKLKVVIESLN